MPQWNIGSPINRSAPLNRELRAWWLCPQPNVSTARWLDIGGRAHGTLTNGAFMRGASGRPGGMGAIVLDGANDYVALPANLTLFQNVGFMAAAAWVYMSSIATSTEIVTIGNNSGGTASRFALEYITGSGFRCGGRAGDAEAFQLVTATANASVDTWYHLVGVIDLAADSVVMYVNGEAIATTGTPAFTATTTSNTASVVSALGAEDNGSANFFAGMLDDIRLYARLLPAEEVRRLYQASKTGYRFDLNWIADQQSARSVVAAAPTPPRRHIVLSQAVARSTL